MNIYLKIKLKSLAAEAKLIREEERKQNPGHRARVRARRLVEGKTKTNGDIDLGKHKRILKYKPSEAAMSRFWGLRYHRTGEVRSEARSSNIAYGFLRGLTYKMVENSCKSEPDWTRIEALVRKYGSGDPRLRMQRFSEWKAVAEEPEAKAA